ncbi:MAG: hypothetical protein IPN38_14055 [Flavobacteriales bacterium]|nr:hypothetical protein [Flavobacteriales bacterium]
MIGRSLTIAFLALSCSLSAQRNMEVGLAVGATQYYGDLGNWDSPIQWNSTRPGVCLTVRDFLNNPRGYVTRSLTMEGRFSWHRLGYNEAEPTDGLSGLDLKNFRRGLNFRTDLYGVSAHVVLNAYREPFKPLFQQRFFMYFYTGLGVFYGKPKGDLFRGDANLDNRYFYWDDGTIRDAPRESESGNVIEQDGTYETDLYSWATEGDLNQEGVTVQRPSPWHIGIPFGMGVRYMVTKQISVGAEFSYYTFATDYLDNVSGRYATYGEIGSVYVGDSTSQYLARYISDPTGWGTDGTVSIRSSRRGNPGMPDYFSYLSFEVSYKFKRKPSRRLYMKF